MFGYAAAAMAVVLFVTIGVIGARAEGEDASAPPLAPMSEAPREEIDLAEVLPALNQRPPNRQPELTPASARVAPAPTARGPVTGFPLPRYVSLGATEANARRGPSRSHRIDWVFTRRGMPVMIVAEHGHWRRVVDRDGVGGWMHYSLLSGVRTAIVEQELLPLYSRPDTASPVRAHAQAGVIGQLRECVPEWCLMDVAGHRGWVDPGALWGVEPGEVFD